MTYESLPPPVCAVVVTYYPGLDMEDNVRAIAAECAAVIVVDNGSGEPTLARLRALPAVEVVSLSENLGIAAALNRGAARAWQRGFEWMITMDQDSRPAAGLAVALWATRQRFPRAAVVGANIEEPTLAATTRWLCPHPHCRWRFQRVTCAGDMESVTMAVTSGALTDLAMWSELGGFDERLFIDFVDTDFCLRCRASGRTIAVSAGARLRHRLGRRETRRFLGLDFHPTHHAPLRYYYIARNRVPMIRRHARREPHWFFYECGVVLLWFFRVVAFEEQKVAKLRAMALGTVDGFRGEIGRCSAEREVAMRESA